jgi:YaiO family outer membrane protein
MRVRHCWHIAFITVLLLRVPAIAQQDESSRGFGLLEITGGYSYDGDHNWSGPSFRGEFQGRDSNITWNGQVSRVQEFGDIGVKVQGGVTYDLSERWYTNTQVETSSGGFFLPGFLVGGSISREWFNKQQLITSIGIDYTRWKDMHTDYNWPISASYQLTSSWSAQAGVDLTVSTPGNVLALMKFLSITQGREHRHLLTFQGEFGREAFQIIAPQTTISNFSSQEVTLKWRQWVHQGWGVALSGGYYSNPYYQRKGAALGLFKEF